MYSRGDDIKRENILRNLKEQTECEDDNANNILTLSKTRWTVRAVCFTTNLDNYTVLWNVWKLSPKRPDENRVKITHNRRQNTNGIFSSIFWSQSWSQNFFPYR